MQLHTAPEHRKRVIVNSDAKNEADPEYDPNTAEMRPSTINRPIRV